MKYVALLACGFALLAAPQKSDDPERWLQSAIQAETVDGDLKTAIEQYNKIIGKVGASREVVAKALVRLGMCYERQGNAEARKQYERVVRDYVDQTEAVAQARTRLGNRSAGVQMRQVWKPPMRISVDNSASRDGRYLPYVDWSQRGDLFLHDFTTGLNRRLTDTGISAVDKVVEYAEEASVSQDGRQVAYSWFTGGARKHYDLRVVDLKQDEIPRARVLLNNPDIHCRPDDWSPDGKWIAVQITRTDNTTQIGLVSTTDGSVRVLKSIDWRGVTRLLFSPDGKYLGYDLPASSNTEERGVFVLAVDGSHEIPAVARRGQNLMMGWSPDGKRLLFASDRTGRVDVLSVGFGDGRTQGEPEVVKADIGDVRYAGMSRSGAMYLWLSSGGGFQSSKLEVARLDPGTGKLLSTPTDVARDHLESDLRPNWSADGKYLAYLSYSHRGMSSNAVIVIRSAETSQIVRDLQVGVDLSNNYTAGPSWAPDGRSLMLQGRDLKGRWGVYQADAQTGEVTPLVLDPKREIWFPSWGHDGKTIYFSRFPLGRYASGGGFSQGGGESIWIERDLASGSEKELLRGPFVASGAPSPDGRYIFASAVDGAGRSRVKLILPAEGGEPRVVARLDAEVEAADLPVFGKGVDFVGVQWAPDSHSFFARKKHFNNGTPDEMWRVPVDGSGPVKIDFGDVLSLAGPILFRPEGSQIAFVVTERILPQDRGYQLWALENFLPTLTAKK